MVTRIKDFVGNELSIGDDVVYLLHSKTSSHFVESKVERFTDKCVFMVDGKRKELNKVIKIIQ